MTNLVFLGLGVLACAWRLTSNRKSQNLSNDKEKNIGIPHTAFLLFLNFFLLGRGERGYLERGAIWESCYKTVSSIDKIIIF